MGKDPFTERQVMLKRYFEFYHYYDEIPPRVEFHQHPFYEVFFFLSGTVRYSIEGKTYRLRPGDILLTNNMDIHRPEILPGEPYERFVIWLADDYFERVRECGDDISQCFRDAARKDYRLIRPDHDTLIRLRDLCDRIDGVKNGTELGCFTLASAYLMEFLVYLSRGYYATPDSVRQDVTEDSKINLLLLYLNEHITEDLSLDDLAERFYVSKFYLSKQFKQYTGMSLYQYVIKKRLTVARNLLLSGEPVTRACFDCGFRDYSNFLKAFKREFGKNPRDCGREPGLGTLSDAGGQDRTI